MKGVRFAPSPTGRFHVGNLRTAWISHEWAKMLGEPWILRFEDIDSARVLPGAQAQQLADMAQLGLHSELAPLQSTRLARHRELFAKAHAEGKVYPCFCSRSEVQAALRDVQNAPHETLPVYAGSCRDLSPAERLAKAGRHPTVGWRLRAADPSGADDALVGRGQTGDSPADFTPAYQWACAADDLDGGYKLLVRAWDLESSARVQRDIQRLLGAQSFAAIYHCALVVDSTGHRLEKRTQGVTLQELTQQGISASELVRRFHGSWEGAGGFAPGRLWGEATRELRLPELGF